MKLKTVDQVDLREERVFVRVDFNVPLESGTVSDDTRIVEVLPTIRHIQKEGARCIILASHLGRPKGKPEPRFSLAPVGRRLSDLLGQDVVQAKNCIGNEVAQQIRNLGKGEVILLENLRFHPEEETNDAEFAKGLASLADVYINDAFGSAHRAHASTVGMARYVPVRAAGFLMKREIEFLEKIIVNPQKPFSAVLGGAKVSDKIGVIQNLLDRATSLLIGGAMAYTFMAAREQRTGKSRVEDTKFGVALEVLKQSDAKHCRVFLPVDHLVADTIDSTASTKVVPSADFPPDMIGVDIGPETIRRYSEEILRSRTVLWNGPMGIFEIDRFSQGTQRIAEAIARSGALSVVGGGDSVAAVKRMKIEDKISHISTGGGASLEFIEGKKLPGIEALT